MRKEEEEDGNLSIQLSTLYSVTNSEMALVNAWHFQTISCIPGSDLETSMQSWSLVSGIIRA